MRINRPRDEDGSVTRVTGFWALLYGKYNKMARYKFDWPVGSIEVRGDSIVLDVKKPFGAFFRLIVRRSRYPIPLVIPFEKIDSVRVRPGIISAARIESTDPVFRLVRFGAVSQARFDALIDRLRALGVKVD